MKKLFVSLSLFALSFSAHADEVAAAVAANFTAPMKEIAAMFEKDSGNRVKLSFGSTGKLYAQIANGAPFDVFLSANDSTPAKMGEEGKGVAGSRFTYAVGKLVLWSAKPGGVDDKGEVLKKGDFAHVAMANPKLAPYGLAAEQAMKKLGVWDKLKDKVVMGDSITQAYQFAATGNAELGFIAKSQLMKEGTPLGSAWDVPQNLYEPIYQDAILVKPSKAAEALLAFLKSPKAQEVIKRYGYGLR